MKRGIIQSRGLGDIIIALPIAHYYYKNGDEIFWPICEEFYPSFKDTVPWVNWLPMVTDPQGLFFFDTPVKLLTELNIDLNETLYLYQYLSARPDLTDPELFSILKFDQYKYWVSGVPFREKWNLKSCITRDLDREAALISKLNLTNNYCVTHLKGSDFNANLEVNWFDKDMKIVPIDPTLTDNIFDWLGVLERCDAFVGIDSVFSNLVDSWGINTDLYWIRRSAWDLTPVLGSTWTMISTDLPTTDPNRVNPAAQAAAMIRKS